MTAPLQQELIYERPVTGGGRGGYFSFVITTESVHSSFIFTEGSYKI